MILLTTSRRPTQRIRTLLNELSFVIPNSIRINRGKLSLDGIAEKALELNADKAIILDRWKGELGKIEFYQFTESGFIKVPPLIYVRKLKLQREFEGKIRQKIKNLAVFAVSHELAKLGESLSKFFDIPFINSEKEAKHYETLLQISHNISGAIKISWKISSFKKEIGPRITVSHVIWELKR